MISVEQISRFGSVILQMIYKWIWALLKLLNTES